jgi:hypothetical protein
MIKSMRMRWARHVRRMGNLYRGFVGKSERKRLLGKHRHRWEHNIEINLRAIEWEYRLDSSTSG